MINFRQYLKNTFYLSLSFFAFTEMLTAEFLDNNDTVCGKIEVAPAALRLELMDSGKQHHKMNMYGYRIDACWLLCQGWCLKPVMLMGWGDGSFYTASCAFGRCIPMWNEKLIVTPFLGYSWSYLTTKANVSVPTEFGTFTLPHIEHKFRGTSPFVGIDILWNFAERWRVGGSVQYGFSRSWTKIKDIFHGHSHSQGPAYGFSIERDLNKKSSINLGVGYNYAYDKEKSGLKGKGIKLGYVYWF